MIPFFSKAGTYPHVTKMLVELVLCPLTLSGGAEGSDVKYRKKLDRSVFFIVHIKKIATAYNRSSLGLECVWR